MDEPGGRDVPAGAIGRDRSRPPDRDPAAASGQRPTLAPGAPPHAARDMTGARWALTSSYVTPERFTPSKGLARYQSSERAVKLDGGSAWESNPPAHAVHEALTGFEDRAAHQHRSTPVRRCSSKPPRALPEELRPARSIRVQLRAKGGEQARERPQPVVPHVSDPNRRVPEVAVA